MSGHPKDNALGAYLKDRRTRLDPAAFGLSGARRRSPVIDAMWRDNDVRSYGDGVKQLRHPILGPVAFEYSSFAVDGRPDLSMVVYNPATPEDASRIRALLA